MPTYELIDIFTLLGGEYGWLFAMGFLAYELALPDSIGPINLWDTRVQKQLQPMEKKLNTILETQTYQIQIIRAMSRKVEGVNSDEVDNYLRKNGVRVETFIEENNDN